MYRYALLGLVLLQGFNLKANNRETGEIQPDGNVTDISVASPTDLSWALQDGSSVSSWELLFAGKDGSPCSNNMMTVSNASQVCTVDGTRPGSGHACHFLASTRCYKYTVIIHLANGKTVKMDPRVIVDNAESIMKKKKKMPRPKAEQSQPS